jgi:pimeloyl-ACP methyl ester carboxylesterase
VPDQYRPEHYVEDVVAFLDDQLKEPFTLFGHSLGGWIALLAAERRLHQVRALILGDPPLNLERFLAFESGEERIGMWSTMRNLLGSTRSVRELAAELASLPASAPGTDAPSRLGDLPGIDATYLRAWAKTLRQVDPDVVQYHAQSRLDEYVANVNLDAALQRMTCPVLVLQGDPSHGGVLSDSDVEHALSLLPDGLHVQLNGAGHDLGLGNWEVTPLLRALTNFLASL